MLSISSIGIYRELMLHDIQLSSIRNQEAAQSMWRSLLSIESNQAISVRARLMMSWRLNWRGTSRSWRQPTALICVAARMKHL